MCATIFGEEHPAVPEVLGHTAVHRVLAGQAVAEPAVGGNHRTDGPTHLARGLIGFHAERGSGLRPGLAHLEIPVRPRMCAGGTVVHLHRDTQVTELGDEVLRRHPGQNLQAHPGQIGAHARHHTARCVVRPGGTGTAGDVEADPLQLLGQQVRIVFLPQWAGRRAPHGGGIEPTGVAHGELDRLRHAERRRGEETGVGGGVLDEILVAGGQEHGGGTAHRQAFHATHIRGPPLALE